MIRLTRLVAACTAALMVSAVGCGPRADVASKHILDRIDDALGKMDVQRAEIESGIKAARKGADGVRSARIKAEVQLGQMDEKVRPFEEQMSKCEKSAGKLKELLMADKPVEIAGKTYTVAQLKEMAVKVIQTRKEAEAKINGFKTGRENLSKIVSGLKEREQALQNQIAGLQTRLVSLDAELEAAKAMKAAAVAAGDGDATLTANLDDLDKKIAALTGEVRVQLQIEGETQRVSSAEKELANIDTILQSTQKPDDQIAELDAMSGKK